MEMHLSKSPLKILGLAVGGLLMIVCGCREIDGSGRLVSEKRNVGSFQSVALEGAGKVFLSVGQETSVEVTTDDNLIDEIETRVSDGQLRISPRPNSRISPTKLEIRVVTPSLHKVNLEGSGLIASSSKIETDELDIDLGGSGTIDLEVDADKVYSKLSGSGKIQLRGTANYQDMQLSGSGDLESFELETLNSVANVAGSGTCKVTASDSLKIHISGSGNVIYQGRPALSIDISGSGRATTRE